MNALEVDLVLHTVLSFLPPGDVACAARTARRWARAAAADAVWRTRLPPRLPATGVRAVDAARALARLYARAAPPPPAVHLDEEAFAAFGARRAHALMPVPWAPGRQVAVEAVAESSHDSNQTCEHTLSYQYFWSSVGRSDKNGKEFIIYRLEEPLTLVSGVYVDPAQLRRVYAPTHVQVTVGMTLDDVMPSDMTPYRDDDDPDDPVQQDPGAARLAFQAFKRRRQAGADIRLRGSLAPQQFDAVPLEDRFGFQCVRLPAPAVGGFVRVDFCGFLATHFVAGLERHYYHCIDNVVVAGWPLSELPRALAEGIAANALHPLPRFRSAAASRAAGAAADQFAAPPPPADDDGSAQPSGTAAELIADDKFVFDAVNSSVFVREHAARSVRRLLGSGAVLEQIAGVSPQRTAHEALSRLLEAGFYWLDGVLDEVGDLASSLDPTRTLDDQRDRQRRERETIERALNVRPSASTAANGALFDELEETARAAVDELRAAGAHTPVDRLLIEAFDMIVGNRFLDGDESSIDSDNDSGGDDDNEDDDKKKTERPAWATPVASPVRVPPVVPKSRRASAGNRGALLRSSLTSFHGDPMGPLIVCRLLRNVRRLRAYVRRIIKRKQRARDRQSFGRSISNFGGHPTNTTRLGLLQRINDLLNLNNQTEPHSFLQALIAGQIPALDDDDDGEMEDDEEEADDDDDKDDDQEEDIVNEDQLG